MNCIIISYDKNESYSRNQNVRTLYSVAEFKNTCWFWIAHYHSWNTIIIIIVSENQVLVLQGIAML